MTNKIYRTATGKIIDYEALLIKNETVNAVGNNSVNARGDEIGPGGEIIRSKNDVLADYYAKNPNAVRSKETYINIKEDDITEQSNDVKSVQTKSSVSTQTKKPKSVNKTRTVKSEN